MRASVEDSLARLGPDRVGILSVHDPELSGVPGATESALTALAELLDTCDAYGVRIVAGAVFNSGLPAAALQYPLRDPRVASVVAGAAAPDQVHQNRAHLVAPIPSEVWQQLIDRRFIPA